MKLLKINKANDALVYIINSSKYNTINKKTEISNQIV